MSREVHVRFREGWGCNAPAYSPVPADGPRLHVPGGDSGRRQSQGAELPALEHLTADFCVAALEEAMAKFGVPEIFNADQGSQFTCEEWTERLKRAGVANFQQPANKRNHP